MNKESKEQKVKKSYGALVLLCYVMSIGVWIYAINYTVSRGSDINNADISGDIAFFMMFLIWFGVVVITLITIAETYIFFKMKRKNKQNY